MVKILDCTLRDGGYYTNWDFDREVVSTYIDSTNRLPVDYLEVGYRSQPLNEYLGQYFYCPVYVLEALKEKSNKKLVIILNEKDVRPENVKALLEPIVGLVSMVRIAIDPQHLGRAIATAAEIKALGFEVGFNVMYMSKWNQFDNFPDALKLVDSVADYFYMVDSYGGVFPEDVIETIRFVRQYCTCKLGFHGHNNLELALVNSLTAIEHGVEMIDATIQGMGRGAGNLKTELLLSVLGKRGEIEVDFNALGDVVYAFDNLLVEHQWGTNLPYMISGSNSLPQKDVMDWVTTRFYSFNSIIQALRNQKDNVADNAQFPVFDAFHTPSVLIIGGGKNAAEHAEGIRKFIAQRPGLVVIHASTKNASYFKNLPSKQIFCLVGSEGRRMETVFADLGDFDGICVLPPYPRKMGTYVPQIVSKRTFELPEVSFTQQYKDSHTALALQTALLMKPEKLYLVGYDGYQNVPISGKERDLTFENELLFSLFKNWYTGEMLSLTTSQYQSLPVASVYSGI